MFAGFYLEESVSGMWSHLATACIKKFDVNPLRLPTVVRHTACVAFICLRFNDLLVQESHSS